MTTQDAPLAARRVAGYRVLRSLARDEDAEVLLGFREREVAASGPDSVDADSVREPATVALKTSEATPTRWAATVGALEALERARGDHVVRVLDVDTVDGVLCVVFERLPNGSLAELFALRERLDAGEVVTIVAPLAKAVERMHAAGVAHGAIGVRTVMFRADGAPVLIGFGSANVFPPGSPEVVLEREPRVGADRRALRELACLLLSRVVGPRGRATRGLIAELESCPEEFVLELLGRRLFEVAAALPVRFTVDEEQPTDSEATRVVPIGTPVDDPEEARPSAGRWTTRVIPEAWVQRVLDAVDGSPAAPALAAVARGWRAWTPRHRRLVLGVGVAALAVSGALAVIPSAPPATADAAVAPSSAPTDVSTATDDPGASGVRARAVEGDDPLAAAIALVAERDRCRRSLSQLCLDGVDQPDSGALRDDREAIRAAQQGGELPNPLVPDGSVLAPELVERLGNSALVRLAVAVSASPDVPSSTPEPQREPASLLLVKGEAGWHIRDVIAAPSNSTGAD